MQRLGAEIDRPISFGMIQVDAAPDLWREQLDISAAAHAAGSRLYPQIAARPFGMLFGFDGHHAFTHRPTFRRLKAECSREELAQRLADPAVKAAILPRTICRRIRTCCSTTCLPSPSTRSAGPTRWAIRPTTSRPTSAPWRRSPPNRGEDPLSTLYDLMLEHDATSMLMLPFYNYAYGNHDAIREMLTHPAGVVGLSDGGAHCGMICDASFPTFLLTHWARDRHRGEKLPLEYVVRKQSYDTAQLFGLSDRGVVEIGKRADVNVIDMDAITLASAPDGLRPAGRREAADPGRLGLRRDDRQRRRDPPRRRRHRRTSRPIGARGPLAEGVVDQRLGCLFARAHGAGSSSEVASAPAPS